MSIVNCPECSKEISDAAPSCPNCGFPLQERKSVQDKTNNSALKKDRKVGLLLGTGILFVPLLFSWFTLRSGYSNTARVVSLIWLAFVFTMLKTDFNDTTVAANPGKPASISNDYWMTGNYVDEFNKPTGETYSTNRKRIIGRFSNTATENSLSGIDLLIHYATIDIKLYEYNRDVPVKSSHGKKYSMNFMYDNKKYPVSDYSYVGEMFGDRIHFEGQALVDIERAIESKSEILFIIRESENITTKYEFSIPPTTNFVRVKQFVRVNQ